LTTAVVSVLHHVCRHRRVQPGTTSPELKTTRVESGHEDGRVNEAAGRWRSRDSMLFRWRGCVDPTLFALRRWRAPSEGSEDSRSPQQHGLHPR